MSDGSIGEIFRFGGGLCLMVFQGTQRQSPSAMRSRVSVLRAVIATGSSADLCGPFSIAACLSSIVQSLPQSTGHPLVAYRRRLSAAAWWRAPFRGRIVPIYLGLFGLLRTYLDMGLTLSPLRWGVTWAFGTVGLGLSFYAVVAAQPLVGAGQVDVVVGGYLRLLLGETVLRVCLRGFPV